MFQRANPTRTLIPLSRGMGKSLVLQIAGYGGRDMGFLLLSVKRQISGESVDQKLELLGAFIMCSDNAFQARNA